MCHTMPPPFSLGRVTLGLHRQGPRKAHRQGFERLVDGRLEVDEGMLHLPHDWRLVQEGPVREEDERDHPVQEPEVDGPRGDHRVPQLPDEREGQQGEDQVHVRDGELGEGEGHDGVVERVDEGPVRSPETLQAVDRRGRERGVGVPEGLLDAPAAVVAPVRGPRGPGPAGRSTA